MSTRLSKFRMINICWVCNNKHYLHEECDSDYEDDSDEEFLKMKNLKLKNKKDGWLDIKSKQEMYVLKKNEKLLAKNKQRKKYIQTKKLEYNKKKKEMSNYFKKRMKK